MAPARDRAGSAPAAVELDTELGRVPGIRPAEARLLGRLGVITVRDLLHFLPYAVESYGAPVPIAGLREGEQATVVARVMRIVARRTSRKGMNLTEAVLADGSGRELKVVWFNQPYIARQVRPGEQVAVAGLVRRPQRSFHPELHNPHLQKVTAGEPIKIGGLMPKYHLTQGLTSRRVAEVVTKVLDHRLRLPEPLPPEVLARHRLISLPDAVLLGHRPERLEDWNLARQRLAFSELFELQLAFAMLKQSQAAEPATPVPFRLDVIEALKLDLGFQLTRDQRRSAWEIFRDMERPVAMNRLLDGDVGSGKTAVAAAAVAMAHAAGLQSVVMAPTEVLARQHLDRFRAYLEGPALARVAPGIRVELLVSGMTAPERRRVREEAATHMCTLVVGTHALIEEEVAFANLGLAIVDEQHRFGTGQRERLRRKGRGRPHFLAMTATPIPRTLALASCGEMDLSVIEELPPGRTPVTTRALRPSERDQAYQLIRAEVAAGRQAFVICPLIEDSEALEVRSATAEFERLKREVFPDLRLDLVHGRRRDKDQVMRGFASGQLDVLVATAVVEVGVDIANASVILIEGANRFGLAQLHQFRGRVGRGLHPGYCLLIADDEEEARFGRLRLMEQIADGFQLAERDLELRGAGELVGVRQHGVSDLAMRALLQPDLLNEIREEAAALVAADPRLDRHPLLREAVARRYAGTSLS